MTSKFRHLSDREVRTINAFAEILIPEGGIFPLGYKDVDIISFAENFLAGVPLRVRVFVYVNLWLIEYFSWIAVLPPWVFSKMSVGHREKIIRKLRKNRWFAVRGIYMLVSIILLMAFYSEPRVMNEIGYTGHQNNINKFNIKTF